MNRLGEFRHSSSNFIKIQSEYGTKAAGLTLLPGAWTTPFLALPTLLFREWKSSKVTISTVLRRFGINLWPDVQRLIKLGFDRVIVRSSATDEDLDDRGQYISVVEKKDLTFEKLCETITQIYEDYSRKKRSGEIGLVIQGYVTSDVSGHLSNEVRLTPTRNQWQFEIEKPSYGPPQGLNSKFSPSADDRRKIKRAAGESLSTVLRRLAQWVNSHASNRTHLEWCLAQNVLWVFQLDIESETSIGADPQNIPKLRRKEIKQDIKDTAARVFQQYEVGHDTKWAKLQNVNDFQIGDKPTGHRLFFSTAGNVKSALRRPGGAKKLASEIDSLTGGRAVVRTDTTNKTISRFNMARTHTVTGAAAVEWMRRQISLYEKQKNDLEEMCFITHGFIPARAAAWTYYVPGSEIVEVDALWGLPDGLQFLPHDSFQCDPTTGKILSEKIRFKPQFLKEQENGSWRYEAVARQYGRSRTLSSEALRELALKTVAIAKKLDGAAQVMWFCDIPPDVDLGKHLPWYRAKEISERIESRRPPFKTVNVSSKADLSAAEHADSGRVILRIIPDAKLIRDEQFLDAVITTAKQNELPIELAGSLLGHAYYKMISAGLVVYTAEPYSAYYRVRGRKTFHKLVRDEIPRKIEMGGETIIQARLSDNDAIYALLGKLIEEGQELGRAKTDNERVEELADIYEILRALAARCGKEIREVELAAQKKRDARGGFNENTVLIETHLPFPGKKSDVEGGRKELALHEIGNIRIENGTAILPLNQLIRPGSSLSFKLSRAGIEIQVTAKLSGAGIELKIGARPAQSAGQRSFDFDDKK